ncbi:hypothetical protein VTK73DRAFT_92 [Phialemonium thermophilum]|uniref:PPIase cyclophilin-type domain-containing protein n=1 Tax=Phialemonium thermophilum TaxID=223376 RepID=A0ABR3Y5D4_9PEZI
MSTIYNLEPQPTASVIIRTTQGDLSVELFAKQTPLTCRNFLQHSLDGYYDNTIFHRLVPGFILQGGDPTGTGNGGESIYDGGAFGGDLDPWPMDQRKGRNAGPRGIHFKDEFHSRLKFNRRGLLGMANEGAPDTNGSQFFFTLNKAEELTGKNTLFGRIAGDTIYNLMKMGEAETEPGSDRPVYPVKIIGIEILINPFTDMKRRERVAPVISTGAPAAEKKPKKRKTAKQLLSFGLEEGDGDDLPLPKKPKFDVRIVLDTEDDPAPDGKTAMTMPKTRHKEAEKTVPAIQENKKTEKIPVSRSHTTAIPDAQSRLPIHEPLRKSPAPEPEPSPKKSLLEKTNEEIAALKASMRRTIYSEPAKEKKKSAFEQLIPESAIRGRKRRPGGSARTDLQSLEMIKAFQNKLKQAAPEKNVRDAPVPPEKKVKQETAEEQDGEGEVCDLHFIANCQSCRSWDKYDEKEESDDEGWMSHSLSFTADKLGKDLAYRKKAEEELVVIDPLEKARTLKEEKRAARESRSGGSSRSWDQDRNAQLTRASAMAGRGAR